MKRYALFIAIALLTLSPGTAPAQSEPLSFEYRVNERVDSGGTTTLNISVGIKNRSREPLNGIGVRITWMAGDFVQGRVDIGTLEADERREVRGDFSVPTEFLKEVPLERLIWEMVYTNAAGEMKKQFYTKSGNGDGN